MGIPPIVLSRRDNVSIFLIGTFFIFVPLCNDLHGDAWDICMWPVRYTKKFCRSFWKEASKPRTGLEGELSPDESALGKRLGVAAAGIPETMILAVFTQISYRTIDKIPWEHIRDKTWKYTTLPFIYAKNCIYTPENRQDQKVPIEPEETDEQFVARLPLSEQRKNILKKRFAGVVSAQGRDKRREKASLAVIKSLPWGVYTQDTLDLAKAKEVLDTAHYGSEALKKTILDYIAVCNLNKNNVAPPMLCLVGPPGVGKTSITKAIAQCLGRHHAIIACASISDREQLVGFSSTYVGAQEGDLLKAFKRAGSMNPVITLDEVDKMAPTSQGALLEVLDSGQNREFCDHFIDTSFDASQAFFFITVNNLDKLPRALQNRMCIIKMNAYENHEKLIIARKFLVPDALKYAGLSEYKAELTHQLNDHVLNHIINHYTEEEGVRDLGRTLKSLCAGAARVVVEHKRLPEITIETLPGLIGNPPTP